MSAPAEISRSHRGRREGPVSALREGPKCSTAAPLALLTSYGNENWEFAADGRMCTRLASINDLPITEAARLFRWPLGPRPEDHPDLSDLGL